MNDTFPPPPSPSSDEDFAIDGAWYGNIQYLLNISTIGLLCCVLIFLFLKLRSDHHRIPGPSALFSKLLSVWHATGPDIARHCGADAAQYLLIEGGSFSVLLSVAVLAVFVLLPVNLYGGTALLRDEFSKTTVSHISKGSVLLWVHFIFVLLVIIFHYGMSAIEERLRITRFRDGNGNLSDPNSSSTAIFTIMVQGLPKNLGVDKGILLEYFQYKYPGKVYRVIMPMDLCALDDLATEVVKVRDEITWLIAKIDLRLLPEESEDDVNGGEGFLGWIRWLWRTIQRVFDQIMSKFGFSDEEKLRKLQELRAKLETELAAYKEGHAQGAGVAFVMFKDLYTANKAVQNFQNEKKRRFGKFFSVMELKLQRNQWKVERAPLATDIYWNHLGSTKLSLKLRRSAARIINAEAIDHAQSWLAWVQSSSWMASLIFQFLPNVIIFVSMYIIVPSVLSHLSKFERHRTALVESSLESAILRMGQCYLDGEDCKRIEQYMSASFLSRSCLSSLAFLITSTFLGISYDLMAPVPWIKKKLQKFRKNDMLQLVPENSEEYPLENQNLNNLRRPLLPESLFDSPRMGGIDIQGQDLSVYPISSRTSPIPKQTFDFVQYYAFNLTIFSLTLIYSCFAPIVVSVGAVYFGYRYVVDKYNFLFVYRVRGFPAGNDGRLMDTVLCIMRFCLNLFLLSMLLFFSVKGDSTKLQAIFTLGLLVIDKLLPSENDSFQPALLEGMQNIDSIIDGPIDYEVFSQPRFDWDTYNL
ncbi:CSC1-like protein [Hibiscus syriacus]|uniref:CSC1-like protein n=1 Tax=Hibiscus syriacus TaxID=106335 RepID=A0A6A2XM83_HIBSY|nr:CSC1-like protein [Hibiscus syriacus]